MEYDFKRIEKKWQRWWEENKVYKVSNDSSKPKYYVLDMFPYPSGAGLHVGHPLGYIASDIYARFKRLKGHNVLHPMGYDAFGLPAEQYAIEHGIHPAVSTETNIKNFRSQLDKIGFCFDWSREVNTSKPEYYKWTQWIFLQLFNSFYNKQTNKAEPITGLIEAFSEQGSQLSVINNQLHFFTAGEWNEFPESKKQTILMDYRLAYCGYGEVNWCEALGTVLANDEVVNGVSERGGHPVIKKKLRQWYLRITEYADRLLEGLEKVEFSEAMKEMQGNWIGKSYGANLKFQIKNTQSQLEVFTTRPDTIFGVDFMVIAPEHELVNQVTTTEQQQPVEEYITYVKSRSERERMAEKKITGVFTGAYAINPFNGTEIPVWISEYVLIGYGAGAIMAVPCGDQRDFLFAKHFNIPITNIIGKHFNGEEANSAKDAILENSGFINGMVMKDAIDIVINKMEEMGIGMRKVNYKMRDAAFSRQRYWGEPFPVVWKDNVAYTLDESELPLELPYVDSYKPGPDGEGPLSNIPEWYLIPNPSPQAEKGTAGAANVPKYNVHTPVQYELARMMRKEHTEAEGVLWELLRGGKTGAKFRRQHPIESYIVDFVSLQDKLVVEVDGAYHENEEQKKYDKERTKALNKIGFNIIRFSNEEVVKSPYKTRDKIKAELQKSPLSTPWRGAGGEVQGVRETNTMPGYAGSSWYFLRYMDPHNDNAFCDRKASDYWNQVDLYIGGAEHAVGHLLYSRMWTKFLYDLGYVGFDEPFRRLVNQGMIQGSSRFVYRAQLSALYANLEIKSHIIFVSNGIRAKIETGELHNSWLFEKLRNVSGDFDFLFKEQTDIPVFSLNPIHVDVNIVDGLELDMGAFRKWKPEYQDAVFICEDGSINTPLSTGGEGLGVGYLCGAEVEKMSKSKFNTVNPDDLIEKYGADTFRMYEMFLGPIEQSKPWDTKGIEGVHRFLKKFWRLFIDETKGLIVTDDEPAAQELKVLHQAIKKIENDTERFSFNTAVSSFMIATNELTDLKCHKKKILESLLILLAPYAPHIAEELYAQLRKAFSPAEPVPPVRGEASVLNASYPVFEEKYIKESTKTYPVAINGKTRTELTLALDATQQQVEEIVLKDEVVLKWLEGKSPKKIIYVQNKMINVVV